MIRKNFLKPGTHINAFGADEPGKIEIDPEVFYGALVVVDDRRLATTDGVLNVASCNAAASERLIDAEIGEVLARKHPGRRNANEITIFGSVGLGFQDLDACDLIYRNAVSREVGTWLDLG